MTSFDKIYSEVKKEMSKFLANQSILMDLNKKIKYIDDVGLSNTLQSKLDVLYKKQKEIEDEAIEWMKRVVDYKQKIETQVKTEGGIYNLMANITALSGEGYNYINQGMKLVGLMLNQNSQVSDLKKSVEQQKIVVNNTELGLKFMYGFLGVMLLFLISKLKK